MEIKLLAMQEQHEHYMRRCLSLAEIALAAGDPPVGSLFVFEGKVIGTGIEAGRSTGDVTNHAEILAVRDAVNNGHAEKLPFSVLYATHEPCIMCSYVIRHHHVPTIVYGTSVPLVGGATSRFNVLSTLDVPKWGDKPTIVNGVCLDECNKLSEAFAKAISKS